MKIEFYYREKHACMPCSTSANKKEKNTTRKVRNRKKIVDKKFQPKFYLDYHNLDMNKNHRNKTPDFT